MVVLASLATAALAATNATFFFTKQMDAAYAVEALDSVRSHGVLNTELVNGFLHALRTTFLAPAQGVCAAALSAPDPLILNGFERHTYFILYPLAPLSAVVPSAALVAVLLASAFVAAVAVVFVFLRVEGVRRLPALAFVALLLASPAWYASATGQYYYDRLFVFVGLAFTLLVHARLQGRRVPLWLLLATGVVGSLINERGALGISLVALATAVGCWRAARSTRTLVPLLALGVTAGVFAVTYLMFFAVNEDYGSLTTSVTSFLPSLRDDETFARNTAKFLAFNAAFLLLALRAPWPLAAAAWLGCVPNLVATIGGAEKTGWSTHYHSYYFPVLVAVAAIGYARLCRPGDRPLRRNPLPVALPAVVSVLAVLTVLVYPFPSERVLDLRSDTWRLHAAADVLGRFTDAADGPARRAQADANLALRELVPAGATVTTSEGSIPALYGAGRTLYYYPLGIGQAEYAVLPFTQGPDGTYSYGGAVSYNGPGPAQELNSCLTERLRAEGFDTQAPVGTTGGVAVLRRS